MPEVASDEVVLKRRAARAAAAEVPEESLDLEETALGETALRTATVRPTRPVIRAKVVYLGGDPFRSAALPGRIMTETIEWKDGPDGVRVPGRSIKRVASTGNTSYVFQARDAANEPIASRIMPDNHPIIEVRGRVFDWTEHPDHAYEFANMRDPSSKRPEFQIVGDKPTMLLLEEYFMRRNRAKRDKKKDFDEISA